MWCLHSHCLYHYLSIAIVLLYVDDNTLLGCPIISYCTVISYLLALSRGNWHSVSTHDISYVYYCRLILALPFVHWWTHHIIILFQFPIQSITYSLLYSWPYPIIFLAIFRSIHQVANWIHTAYCSLAIAHTARGFFSTASADCAYQKMSVIVDRCPYPYQYGSYPYPCINRWHF